MTRRDMSRGDLMDEVIKTATDAGASGHHFVAAVLYLLAQALLDGNERQLAAVCVEFSRKPEEPAEPDWSEDVLNA